MSLIMIRRDGFYRIESAPDVPLEKQALDNAMLNPGTIRVEDIDGNILWMMQ